MRALIHAGAVILLLSVAAIAGGKTGIVWDAGGVAGRDVYSARGNGKKVRLRTGRSDEDATLLTVSPDGRRMAWWLIPPGMSERRDLVVARTAGGRGRNVTAKLDGKVVAAKFTGDSKHLLFVFEEADTERVDLWRVNVRGKGLRNLTREVPGEATGTLWVSPFGATVLVEWEFSDRTGLVLVDVKRGIPSILNAGLPDGAPGDYAFWPEAGVLQFTWRSEGAEKDDLWQLDDVALERRIQGVGFARGLHGLCTVVSRGSELVAVRPDGSGTMPAPGPILDVSGGVYAFPPVVAVGGGEATRVFRVGTGEAPLDLLPDAQMEEVEDISGLLGYLHAYVTVRDAGIRRLYYVRTGGVRETIDLAEGLTGRVGAFRVLTRDGGLIFSMVADHGSAGELYHWHHGERTALIARTNLVGLTGRAVVSPRTGDVLFNVIAMPEADNRVFLWDRKKDEVRALTPEYQRPGTFLFTR